MEKVFQTIEGLANRLIIMRCSVVVLLFVIVNASFEQYAIYDVSFTLPSLFNSVTILMVVIFACYLMFGSKALRFSYGDILFALFILYYIYRYDIDLRLADWKMAMAFLSVVLWYSVRYLSACGICSCTTFSWILISSGGIQALLGVMQLHGWENSHHDLFSMTGSFLNPGPFSGYLAMIFPIVLYQCLVSKGAKFYLSWGIVSVMLCVLPAGMSRAAWLGAALSSCFVFFLTKKGLFQQLRLKRRTLLILGSIGITLGLLVVICVFFKMKEDSAYGRLFIWKNAGHVIAAAPIMGYGSASFSSVYQDTQVAYFKSGRQSITEERVADNPEYAFNEYVQMLVEGGWILLLLFVFWVFYTLRQGCKHGEYGLCGGGISLLVFAFFSYPFQIPAFILAAIIMLASLPQGDLKTTKCGLLTIFAVCVVSVGLGCRHYHLNSHELAESWQKCRLLKLSGAPEIAAKGYEKLYVSLKDNANFLVEYARCLSQQKEYSNSNKILQRAKLLKCDAMIYNIMGQNYQKMRYYQQAESCFLYAANLVPDRIYPYYLLAKLYAEPDFFDKERTEQMANIVLTKSPKVDSGAIDEMRTEIRSLLKKVQSAN